VRFVFALVPALLLVCASAQAQAQAQTQTHDHSMPGMDMPMPAKPAPAVPAPPEPAAKGDNDMAGMDMSGHDMKGMAGMDMSAHGMGAGALGDYPTTQDGSGTSWQPSSAPHAGIHGAYGPWSLMLHGDGTLVYDQQGGPRGQTKTFFESMLMGMASRPLDGGELTLHGMVSLDPTMGKAGYPLLLQTGETADGKNPLIDRQHPHDLIDELSITYSHPISGLLGSFVYVGYPGEPALGPTTYMHRFSGMALPEAPIDHHWLDSTHVTFGVVTAGLVFGKMLKLEVSDFTGRESDEHRWNFDPARFDSASWRLAWNPNRALSMQVSQGWLHSPEQLEPDVNQRRTTASVTYNRAYERGNWQTTAAWGQNVNMPGRRLDAVLLESSASFGPHTVFGRAEQADKDELFEAPDPLAGRAFRVGKVSLGYAYAIPASTHFVIDLGGLFSLYDLPSALEPAYGRDPRSFMLFTRVRLR
jgi:hypothetical protein